MILKCRRCKEWKAEVEFHRDASVGRGRAYRCKPCASLHAKERREVRRHYARKAYLKTNFGMTREEYDQKLEKQAGVCGICEQPESRARIVDPSKAPLAVDHDHETGQVRDLLCGKCNSVLGLMQENPDLLEKAATYLRKWGKVGS